MNQKVNAAVGAAVLLVLMSKDEIKAGQDVIKSGLTTLDQQIHANAVQCMLHCSVHGDTSLMRRLLVETIDSKSGYRKQGLIQWMRKHSPMELKGDNVDLSGVIHSEAQQKAMIAAFPDVDSKLFVVGERRPFLVDQANAADWKGDAAMREQVKPIFQETLLSPLSAAAKRFADAIANTNDDGTPINAGKPYYEGSHRDKLIAFFDTMKEAQAALPHDAKRELFLAKQAQRDATDKIAALEPQVANDGEGPVAKVVNG